MTANAISIQIYMMNDELGILSQRYLEKTNEFLAFVRNRIAEVNQTFIFMQASIVKKMDLQNLQTSSEKILSKSNKVSS